VCSFTIAVNRRKRANQEQPEADYFRISAWDGLAQNCQKYLSKGKKVSVVGPVSCNVYTGTDGKPRASMDVQAENIEFLSPKDDNAPRAARAEDFRGQYDEPQSNGGFVMVDEDPPF
jgi:single-strand DNA-binding protein